MLPQMSKAIIICCDAEMCELRSYVTHLLDDVFSAPQTDISILFFASEAATHVISKVISILYGW